MMLSQYRHVIYAISFLDFFAVGLISPLVGNYLKSLGASYFLIGILSSSYSGLQVISGPLIGSWSDVYDRKNVFKITVLLCSILYLFLGFVQSVTAIFIIRILLGCFKHTKGLNRAMISDLFSPEEQAEMLSYSSVLNTIGFNVGPMIGGYISEMPNGFTYICICTSTLFIVTIMLNSMLPTFKNLRRVSENSSDILRNQEINAAGNMFLKIVSNIKKIDWGENWDLFLLRFLFGISSAFYYYNEGFYLKEYYNLSQSQIGYLMSFRGLVETCAIFLLGNLRVVFYKNDTSCLRRIFHFFVMLSFSSLLLGISSDFNLYVMSITPFVISTAVLRISTMELLLGGCQDQIGAYSGVSNSIMSVARFITPVMSGIISDTLGSQVAMRFSFLPAIAGTILTAKIIGKTKKTE